MMKRLILLIIVFFYIYPIFLRAIPLPLDRLYQILGFALLVRNPKDLMWLYRSARISSYLRLSLILLFLGLMAQFRTFGNPDLYFIKRILNVFLELFSAYFVFNMCRRLEGKANIGVLLSYLVVAAGVQTLISLMFFVRPDLYEQYYTLLNQDVENKDFSDMLAMLKVRFLGIGSSFFLGVNKYGVAFFASLILPFVANNYLTRKKILYWFLVLLVFIGGLLTARSFLIAIVLGILMLSIVHSKSIVSFVLSNLKIILFAIPIALLLYVFLGEIFASEQFDKLFNYAFELFVNFFSGDGFESSSTNRLKEMYILPDNLITWFIGDGRMQSLSGGYYMHTDVGYIRLIFYFGLIGTIYFVYLLYGYFRNLAKATNSRPLKLLFLAIFFWFILLNFKGLAFHSYYFPLFLLFLIHKEEE